MGAKVRTVHRVSKGAVVTSAPTTTRTFELSMQFMAHAESVFSVNNLSLSPDGRIVLLQDLTDGASQMSVENRLSPEDIGQAHYGVGLYSAAIVVGAKTPQPTNPDNLIHSNIIQKAKKFLCPGLWPFC